VEYSTVLYSLLPHLSGLVSLSRCGQRHFLRTLSPRRMCTAVKFAPSSSRMLLEMFTMWRLKGTSGDVPTADAAEREGSAQEGIALYSTMRDQHRRERERGGSSMGQTKEHKTVLYCTVLQGKVLYTSV